MKYVEKYIDKKEESSVKKENIIKRMGNGVSDFFDGFGEVSNGIIDGYEDILHYAPGPCILLVMTFPVVYPVAMVSALGAKLGYVATTPIRNMVERHKAKKEFKRDYEYGVRVYEPESVIKERRQEVREEDAKYDVIRMNLAKQDEIDKKVEEARSEIDSHEYTPVDHGLEHVATYEVSDIEGHTYYKLADERLALKPNYDMKQPKTLKLTRKGQ